MGYPSCGAPRFAVIKGTERVGCSTRLFAKRIAILIFFRYIWDAHLTRKENDPYARASKCAG